MQVLEPKALTKSCGKIRFMILGTADKVTESMENAKDGSECYLADW